MSARGAHGGGEGRGHIVSPRAQLVGKYYYPNILGIRYVHILLDRKGSDGEYCKIVATLYIGCRAVEPRYRGIKH